MNYPPCKRQSTNRLWELAGVAHPPNLALLRANIEKIEEMFAPNEIQRIYLNFSDPWPKSQACPQKADPSEVRSQIYGDSQ